MVRGVVRLSGPLTVEGGQPPELSLSEIIDTVGGFGGASEEVGPTFAIR